MENDSLVQNKTIASTSFNFSGNITAQGGHVLAGNNQFGNNVNFSVNNSQSNLNQSISPVAVNNVTKSTEQSGIDEEIKQPVESNSLVPTSGGGEGCCSLKIGKLGCGNVISFWCFSLEPSAEDVYLVCCPKGTKEQDRQKAENSTNNQNQYQSTLQMEAQVQVDPK